MFVVDLLCLRVLCSVCVSCVCVCVFRSCVRSPYVSRQAKTKIDQHNQEPEENKAIKNIKTPKTIKHIQTTTTIKKNKTIKQNRDTSNIVKIQNIKTLKKKRIRTEKTINTIKKRQKNETIKHKKRQSFRRLVAATDADTDKTGATRVCTVQVSQQVGRWSLASHTGVLPAARHCLGS